MITWNTLKFVPKFLAFVSTAHVIQICIPAYICISIKMIQNLQKYMKSEKEVSAKLQVLKYINLHYKESINASKLLYKI